MNRTDRELVDGVVSGDRDAFAALFARYRRPVHDHLNRIVRDAAAADDLTQVVLLRLWRRAEQWTGQGPLRSWRLRLTGYRAELVGPRVCRVALSARSNGGTFEVVYAPLPAPDDAGILEADGIELVVPPVADPDDLARARIQCVGDRLCDFIESRLGTVPSDSELDEALIRALAPVEREPALVRTGFEPEDPDFWCGRNLLTAFVSWDGYAFDDAVVISESCATALSCPEPLEPGDKLSNRHGTKGVVGRVLPDAEMPRLADGTPVDLIYSLSGVPTRWNMGQIRGAALGRVARAQGRPAVVPPFGAPSDQELRQRLQEVGLAESGMARLSVGAGPLRRDCTVGWVYWGCTIHRARSKIQSWIRPDQPCQRLGRMEVESLREADASVLVRELTNTCSSERDDATTLAERVSAGPVEQPASPSPRFVRVAERLAAAGISVDLSGDGVTFRDREANGNRLLLARPVPHPWLPDETLADIPHADESEPFQAVQDANDRLARLLEDEAPPPLIDGAHAHLDDSVRAFFEGLLAPEDLCFGGWMLFSGRSVIAPGPDLRIDQLGLPEEMAWTLFGPAVSGVLSDSEAVQKRTGTAVRALAEVMADSWIILNRAPSVGPTSLLAFHPVLGRERAIRVHPLACGLMNADFDGDQAAVYLPVTAAAQREAGERLTVLGHLRRDPGLIELLYPGRDALFGLACLSRTPDGRRAIAEAAGRELPRVGAILTRDTVVEILRGILIDEGPEASLATAEALLRLGFRASMAEGGSVGPFLGASVGIPAPPRSDDPDQWLAYLDEVHGVVAAFAEYDSEDLGAVGLLLHCGARGTVPQIAQLFAPPGPIRDVDGRIVQVRHGWLQGLTTQEAMARVVGARKALFEVQTQYGELGKNQGTRERPEGYGVLSRARRAPRPGVVFARAARAGETDPLQDDYTRLFVGVAAAEEEDGLTIV